MYRIATNAALMKLRKERPRRNLTQPGYEEIELPSPGEGPEKLALNSELRQHLEQGLDMLQPNLKTAVVLRDVQGLSNEEAAHILDISVSSLKARLHRGRIFLRQHLQENLASNQQNCIAGCLPLVTADEFVQKKSSPHKPGSSTVSESVFRSEFERVHQFLHGLGLCPCPHLFHLLIHGRAEGVVVENPHGHASLLE